MNLNIEDWKKFKVSKLFPTLQAGKANQGMLEEGNECFYVGAKRNDNGVMIHCLRDENLIQKGNCIIFICNGKGSVGYANYMDVDFIGTTDIVAGYNKNLNTYNGLFLSTIFSKERPKYSFGRKWKTHLADTIVKLPALKDANDDFIIDESHEYSDEGYIPDWHFMETYIRNLNSKPLSTKKSIKKIKPIEFSNWRSFKVSSILKIYNGKGITTSEIEEHPGNFVAVQSGEDNNGVIGMIDLDYCKQKNYTYCTSQCLTVARSGSAGFVSFQKDGCVVGDSAKILRVEEEFECTEIYLFIQTILSKHRFKYAYGRKVTEKKYMNDTILLPVKMQDGEPFTDPSYKYSEYGYVPDWDFMKKYIKSLPYGDRIN